MKNTKLIGVFEALSIPQRRQFKKWYIASVHNSKDDIIKLFDYLYSRRDITVRSVDKTKVFKHLYPREPYNDDKMRLLIHQGLKVVNDFVVFSSVKNDLKKAPILLYKAYQELQLSKYASQQLHIIRKKQDTRVVIDQDYFLQEYELERETFHQIESEKRTDMTNLPQLSRAYTSFFIINTLKYACISSTHSNLRKEAYQIPLLGAVLKEVAEGKYNDIAIIMGYYHSYWALIQSEDATIDHFWALKKIIFGKTVHIAPIDLKEFYLAALNYCIRKLNNNQEEFVKEAFEIYRKGLETKILINEDKLSRYAFKNIVALGLRVKEYQWVEFFISNYSNYLDEVYRENYKTYNLAKLFFEKGEFKKAQIALVQLESDDVFLALDAKVLMLKIYFMDGVEAHDALSSLLDSFSVFLNRRSKQVMSYHKEVYSNIILLAKKITMLNPFDHQKVNELRNQILTTKPLTERDWLLNQLNKITKH